MSDNLAANWQLTLVLTEDYIYCIPGMSESIVPTPLWQLSSGRGLPNGGKHKKIIMPYVCVMTKFLKTFKMIMEYVCVMTNSRKNVHIDHAVCLCYDIKF